jgi:transposase
LYFKEVLYVFTSRYQSTFLEIAKPNLSRKQTSSSAPKSTFLILASQNIKNENLMKIFKVSYKTMYNWLNRWEYEGMLGLYNKPGRGRKETFNSAQSAQIRDWVKLQPKQLKQVVQKIKKEWSVNISTETIKRIIKKKG